MRFAFALTLMAACFHGLVMGQGAAGFSQKLLPLIEQRNYSAAIESLSQFRNQDAKSFNDGNYAYLLGQTAERDGRAALAMSSYHSLAPRAATLAPNAFVRMSALARSTGNLMLERLLLEEILRGDGTKSAVQFRMARNSFERGHYGEAARILNSGGGSVRSREDTTLLASSCLRRGENDRARELFAGLIAGDPKPEQPDDFSLAAVRSLDILDGGTPTKPARLSEADHLRRANIYQFNRDFQTARGHYQQIVEQFPAGEKAPLSMFQIGRGFAQQAKLADAVIWFERLLETFPGTAEAKDGLLQAASAYARLGKSREAIARYQTFIDRYPSDDRLDRAYLNIIDTYRDQDADSEALNWCQKAQENFAGKLPATQALFVAARIFISKDNWPAALEALDKLKGISNLGGSSVPGGTTRAEVAFLRAFVLEQSRAYADAVTAYLEIPDGRAEYYGARATERLKQMQSNESARPYIAQALGRYSAGLSARNPDDSRRAALAMLRLSDSPAVRESALTTLRNFLPHPPPQPPSVAPPAQKPAGSSVDSALLALGLDHEVFSGSPPNNTVIARLALRAGRADLTLAFIEPYWRSVPEDYPAGLIPRDQATLLYPAPFADDLIRHSSRYGIDPRLLLAIMRQESRFDPAVKSYAAARGLMQFISTTAVTVAGELGNGGFDQENLYHPSTAILFGSHYVASLFNFFPGQTEAVLAGYNGGEDNMQRWMRRSRSTSPERYVPEIAYGQTKEYVERVMANYRMYKLIYDEKLVPLPA